jgi:ATP-dependent DNA helicase PIF1
VLVTGSAGTGKSHALRFLTQSLARRESSLAGDPTFGVAAPTGVAAVAVGGSTLHAFFGIGLGTASAPSLVRRVLKSKEAAARIRRTRTLVIDEVSMLSAELLETLDAVAREVRSTGEEGDPELGELPMGGMQLVCFGDFFQLPPISRGGGPLRPFCFDSPVWRELGLADPGNVVTLTEVQRQDNPGFVNLLNGVRTGDVDGTDVE